MPTILSRFDMIFIVKDEHEQSKDMVSYFYTHQKKNDDVDDDDDDDVIDIGDGAGGNDDTMFLQLSLNK